MNTFRATTNALSLLLFLGLGFQGRPAQVEAVSGEMSAAARNFLDALSSEQKATAQFKWANEERMNWHFIPKDRPGLAFKNMEAAQRHLAWALLASGMSASGQIKAATIMSLERILQELEGPERRFSRDPELYHVSIFGEPSPDGTWGWRVEGHHLSVNFSIINGRHISATPSFMGTNPAEVRSGPRQGLRVLAAEEDLGRQLVKSLNSEQKAKAIIDEKAPADVITGASRKVSPLEWTGLSHAKMNKEQRALLRELIQTYAQRYRPAIADADLKAIEKAGYDKILFAWAGGTEKGEGHYYRIQGPTFLMEYDCTQNDANHVHAVWRDFNNDFGEDYLLKHYKEAHR